jgi:hypothetical protein
MERRPQARDLCRATGRRDREPHQGVSIYPVSPATEAWCNTSLQASVCDGTSAGQQGGEGVRPEGVEIRG